MSNSKGLLEKVALADVTSVVGSRCQIIMSGRRSHYRLSLLSTIAEADWRPFTASSKRNKLRSHSTNKV